MPIMKGLRLHSVVSRKRFKRDLIVHSGQIIEQFSRGNRETLSKFDNVFEGDVTLSALDSTNVIAMQTCSLCEFLLREAPVHTKSANSSAKTNFRRLMGHASSCRHDHYESTHDECYRAGTGVGLHERRDILPAACGRRHCDEGTIVTYRGCIAAARLPSGTRYVDSRRSDHGN